MLLGLVEGGLGIDALAPQGAARRGTGALGAGGAQQDRPPHRGRQPSQQRLVHQLQAVADRQRVREGGGTQPLGRGEPARHVLEGQRVAPSPVDQPGRHPLGQAPGQQAGRLGWRQPGQGEHPQPLQRHRRPRPGTHGEQERHRVAAQPPGGEQQCRCRLPIDPLQVVDQHQHRRPLGDSGQQ
jgi:hypothetical protein